MHYVYVLATDEMERKIYIGYTDDLQQRINGHESNDTEYTSNHEWHLVYYESYKNEEDAKEREKQLKQDGRSKYWLKQRIENSLDDITK